MENYQEAVARVKAKSNEFIKDSKGEPDKKEVPKAKSTTALSSKTLDGLQGLAKAMEALPKEPETKLEVPDEEQDDSYYYDESGSKRPNLYSTKRKKDIESRCKPIDLMSMLTKQKAEQVVPIVPDKFVVKLRDITGKEDLFIKQQMAKEIYAKDGLDISKSYMNSKFGLMRLTFSLLSINDRDLSDIQISSGKVDETTFWEKHEYISNFPIDIIEDLDWQLICFMDRVKKITLADIKNF